MEYIVVMSECNKGLCIKENWKNLTFETKKSQVFYFVFVIALNGMLLSRKTLVIQKLFIYFKYF